MICLKGHFILALTHHMFCLRLCTILSCYFCALVRFCIIYLKSHIVLQRKYQTFVRPILGLLSLVLQIVLSFTTVLMELRPMSVSTQTCSLKLHGNVVTLLGSNVITEQNLRHHVSIQI